MKKLIAAALLATSLAAPAQANNAPTRTWWCSPSGMTILSPLNLGHLLDVRADAADDPLAGPNVRSTLAAAPHSAARA